jgi:hypothetical protein
VTTERPEYRRRANLPRYSDDRTVNAGEDSVTAWLTLGVAAIDASSFAGLGA